MESYRQLAFIPVVSVSDIDENPPAYPPEFHLLTKEIIAEYGTDFRYLTIDISLVRNFIRGIWIGNFRSSGIIPVS